MISCAAVRKLTGFLGFNATPEKPSTEGDKEPSRKRAKKEEIAESPAISKVIKKADNSKATAMIGTMTGGIVPSATITQMTDAYNMQHQHFMNHPQITNLDEQHQISLQPMAQPHYLAYPTIHPQSFPANMMNLPNQPHMIRPIIETFDALTAGTSRENIKPRGLLNVHSYSGPSIAASSAQVSASDSASHITTVLQLYQQGGEDSDFVKKAIESLVKKLKDRSNELDALITAITSNGTKFSSCVRITRSLDGRLQVAGRKGVPHVVYARIWRWPNVTKAELKKLPICEVSPENQDSVCVNPYHYERVVGSIMDVSSLQSEAQSQASPFTTTSTSSGAFVTHAQLQSQQSSLLQAQNASIAMQIDPASYEEWQRADGSFGQPPTQYAQMSSTVYSPAEYTPSLFEIQNVRIPPQMLVPFPKYWSTITYFEGTTQIETFNIPGDMRRVSVDGGTDPQAIRQSRVCLGALPNVHRSEYAEKCRVHIGSGISLIWHNTDELFVKVLSSKPIFVRSPFLELCEQLQCLREGLIRQPGSDGFRLDDTNAAEPVKVFDLRWAFVHMKQYMLYERTALLQQAAAVAGYNTTSQAASNLELANGDVMQKKFCSIDISFVKGWGKHYNRETIKDTPCWIQIQLHRALQILYALQTSSTSQTEA